MSNRLESLNPKKPASKPGLKFKPKAVARKSKEDRDRDALEIKSEPPQRQPNSSRGRGATRGRGRGRGGAYVGTHVVSAGPLAMGSVGVGNGTTTTKTGLTSDKIFHAGEAVGGSSLADLKLKRTDSSVKRPDAKGVLDESDSDGEDRTRIDMNKAYVFEDLETVLFPVRPQKFADPLQEPELVSEGTDLPSSVSQTASRAHTVDSVKTEDNGEVAAEEVQEQSPAAAVQAPLLVNPDEKQERDEYNRIIDDQKLIVDMITLELDAMKTDDDPHSSAVTDEKYILIHVPQITPKAGQAGEATTSATTSASHYTSQHTQDFQGQVGSLNFHQSGKITMTIGQNSVFECAGGNPSAFLQELYVIDDHDTEERKEGNDEDTASSIVDADGQKIAGRIYRLGEITGKIVATPAI